MENASTSELSLYIKNQDQLLEKYNGKIIALHGGEVLGAYPSKTAALHDMQKRGLLPGSFLIILCTEGDQEYTRQFRSRVDFASQVA